MLLNVFRKVHTDSEINDTAYLTALPTLVGRAVNC